MSRIPNLPDFSEYIQRDDRIKVHNTVNFVIGEHFIEANGIVISQKSKILLDLAVKNSDIYLDDFVGDLNCVQDCVELLYGGQVEITTINIQTIVKFSVKFEIKSLYQICLDWMNEQICKENIYLLINIGLMVEKMMGNSRDILNICSDYIRDEIKDDLFEINKIWSFEETGLIKFLIQGDILLFTLPILSEWIENDAHIKLIMDQVEMKDIIVELLSQGEKSTRLVEIMSDKVELLETSKRITRLTSTILKAVKLPCSSATKDMKSLMSLDYVSFSVGQIIDTEEEFKLQHFEYIEFIVHWIAHNNPSQSDVTTLWGRVRQEELCYLYVDCVRTTITNSRGTKSYTITGVVDLGSANYQYYFGWKDIKGPSSASIFSDAQLESLLNKSTVVLNIECKMCEGPCDIKLKLDDKTPCYELDVDNTHCTVKHWYVMWYDGSVLYHYSLITNNYSSVIDKIKECVRNNTTMGLHCLYQCVKK